MAFADGSLRRNLEGMGAAKVTLAGAVAVGDLVGYSSGWVRADGDANIPARFVAGEDGASGDEITIFRSVVVSGFSGGTPGAKLYLSATAGGYGASAATLSQVVGVLTAADTAAVEPLWSVDPV